MTKMTTEPEKVQWNQPRKITKGGGQGHLRVDLDPHESEVCPAELVGVVLYEAYEERQRCNEEGITVSDSLLHVLGHPDEAYWLPARSPP